MRITLFLFLVSVPIFMWGQKSLSNTSLDSIIINTNTLSSNTYQFTADTTNAPLVRITQGSPDPYFKFWWEFGDGNMSEKKAPQYTYSDTKQYQVYLLATKRYDDSPPPPKARIIVGSGVNGNLSNRRNIQLDNSYFQNIQSGTNVQLKASSQVKEGEEIAFMLSYRNTEEKTVNGQLAILFNENNTFFEELEVRKHFVEQTLVLDTSYPDFRADILSTPTSAPTISSKMQTVLNDKSATYQDTMAWAFEDLEYKEERNLFFSFKNVFDSTLESQIHALDDTLTLLAVYTTDTKVDTFPLKLAVIRAHDPNKATVSNRRVSFRGFKKKKLKYTIDFQNEGTGPAQIVRISASIPKWLDSESVKVKKRKPETPWLGDKNEDISGRFSVTSIPDSLIFLFDGIDLQGMRQDGMTKEDSTKGFVQFEIKPKRRIRKKTLGVQAAIKFNREDDIITNIATTRFKPGLSIGVKGGISNFNSSADGLEYTFGGLTFSPFKSERFYYQGEVMGTIGSSQIQTISREVGEEELDIFDTNDNGVIERTELSVLGDAIALPADGDVFDIFKVNQNCRNFILDIVPLQLRKDLLPFLGIGAGVQTSLQLKRTEAVEFTRDNPNGQVLNVIYLPAETQLNVRPSLFADLNIGLIKQGPSVGLRYHYTVSRERPQNYWRAYALFKF